MTVQLKKVSRRGVLQGMGAAAGLVLMAPVVSKK